MKHKLIIIVFLVFSVLFCNAQNANTIMSRVIDRYTSAKNISADFELSSSQMKVDGNIVMNGMKFRILANDFKCWYDGKNQWLYTIVTKEVNILEPAREELEASNPYLAVMRYNTKYRAVLKSNRTTNYVVELISKNPYVDMTNILLTIDKNSYQITEAEAIMIDGGKQTIKFGNYVLNAKLPAEIFVFDSTLVPAGTQVIDLR